MQVHLSVLAASLLALSLPPVAFAAGPASAEALNDYAQAHQLVDIGEGRRLNLYCKGTGSPTVVFDSGSGLAAWDWWLVHPAVAEKARACVYDRAGLGFSDPATRPGTSANAVDDLHALLTRAEVKPPYVLVGHSYGGMNVQLYAYTYPQEVAGLVSVDAPHEDENDRIDQMTGGKLSKMLAQVAEFSQQCVEAAHRGMAPGSDEFRQCVGQPPAAFSTALSAVYLSKLMSPATWDAAASEATHEVVSAGQLRAARQSFGDLPLVYLTRGISPYLMPGKPPSALNQATEKEVLALHDQIARLSTRGSNRLVPGAGHSIQVDKPQAVIDAVKQVLAQARVAPVAP